MGSEADRSKDRSKARRASKWFSQELHPFRINSQPQKYKNDNAVRLIYPTLGVLSRWTSRRSSYHRDSHKLLVHADTNRLAGVTRR